MKTINFRGGAERAVAWVKGVAAKTRRTSAERNTSTQPAPRRSSNGTGWISNYTPGDWTTHDGKSWWER